MQNKLLMFTAGLLQSLHTASEIVPLIIDTDMSTDVDDVLAIAMAHALVDLGEAELVAVVHNTGLPTGAGAISVINHFYGRDDVLIGAYKGNFDNPEFSEMLDDTGRTVSGPYVDKMLLFPSPIRNNTQVPTAVEVYRAALASQLDHSVVIANIGFNLNMAALLQSGPDAASTLTGIELVARKVKAAYVMGGQYPTSFGGGGGYEGDSYEWNFGGGCKYHAKSCPVTPAATAYVVRNWPAPMVFLGFEVGNVIYTGRPLIDDTLPCPSANSDLQSPVRQAFVDYLPWNEVAPVRQSWDPATVLVAVRGVGRFFDLSAPGTNLIGDVDGSNAFVASKDGEQSYLILREIDGASQVAAAIDELVCRIPLAQSHLSVV